MAIIVSNRLAVTGPIWCWRSGAGGCGHASKSHAPAKGRKVPTGAAVAGHATSSVQTQEVTGVWLVGMRYKIMDATTTEQVAQGYSEEKMEVGATSSSVMGVSEGAKGGVGLDTMVQRLIQKTVWEIDSKYK